MRRHQGRLSRSALASAFACSSSQRPTMCRMLGGFAFASSSWPVCEFPKVTQAPAELSAGRGAPGVFSQSCSGT